MATVLFLELSPGRGRSEYEVREMDESTVRRQDNLHKGQQTAGITPVFATPRSFISRSPCITHRSWHKLLLQGFKKIIFGLRTFFLQKNRVYMIFDVYAIGVCLYHYDFRSFKKPGDLTLGQEGHR